MNGKTTNFLLTVIASLMVIGIAAGVKLYADVQVIKTELKATNEGLKEANKEKWPRSQAELLWQRQSLVDVRQDTLSEAMVRRLDAAELYLERLKERDRLGKDIP
jgi:hypothetical protein